MFAEIAKKLLIYFAIFFTGYLFGKDHPWQVNQTNYAQVDEAIAAGKRALAAANEANDVAEHCLAELRKCR